MTATGGRSRSLMFLRFPARLSHYGGHGPVVSRFQLPPVK
jgi:hypothetical protein